MRRWLLASTMALLATLVLFSLMAWMVDNRAKNNLATTAELNFTLVMSEPDKPVQRRPRSVPEPTPVPQIPTSAPIKAQATQALDTTTFASQIDLNLTNVIDGVEISAPQLGEIAVNQQVMPLYRVEPQYPSKALQRGVEGYVILRFTIDELGKTRDIQVLEANPKRYFEREAISALRHWKYQPKTVDGQAVSQLGQTVRLEFKLNQ